MLARPRLLDLFCGAGGAAVGYHRAGFDVVGVDIAPQPNYPFDFIQDDALDVIASVRFMQEQDFYAVHASPPCQAYSTTRALHGAVYPDLVGRTRELLNDTGLPWVIENVVGAPLHNPIRLCGSSFGLGVWRHRLFELGGFDVGMVPPCSHQEFPGPLDVTGTGARRLEARTDGGGGNSRKPRSLDEAGAVMGINWMTRRELAQAVPPAYTEFIGAQLLQHVGFVCNG